MIHRRQFLIGSLFAPFLKLFKSKDVVTGDGSGVALPAITHAHSDSGMWFPNMTGGTTIPNQGANDDEILVLKSADVRNHPEQYPRHIFKREFRDWRV